MNSPHQDRKLAVIHSTRLHLVLYSLLLVFTPFLLLRNFLVDLISHGSGTRLSLGPLDLPLVPTVAALALGLGLVLLRKSVNRRWFLAGAIVIAMDALAQQLTDLYTGHNFYDLQQNWHYVAYGLFAYMTYRDFAPRGWPLARILWLSFFAAMAYSTFDETFQMRMSSRIFDISDIAKDVWGCLMGMVLITVPGRRWGELTRDWRRLLNQGARDSFGNPLSALCLMVVFGVILLSCGSLLSDFEYVAVAASLALLVFAVVLGAYLLVQRRWGRVLVAVVCLALLIVIGGGWLRHRNGNVTKNRYGFTVIQGVPVPFFDFMVYPNGHFRLVDKKHFFNMTDQEFILARKTDIVLIGNGAQGLGGRGFPETSMVQFLYNPNLGRATQVIIMRTPEACQLFNRLMREHKNVLFILHNTC